MMSWFWKRYQPMYTYPSTNTTPMWESESWTVEILLEIPEEEVRRIVRQELADIMPIDVPDVPPEE